MPPCVSACKQGPGAAAAALFGLCLAVWAAAVQAAEMPAFELTIREHRFEPETLHVPAGTRFKLVIRNADPTAEEFESYELNREQVIQGDGEETVYIGPLKAGTYPFVGEFHEDTAKGQIIAE